LMISEAYHQEPTGVLGFSPGMKKQRMLLFHPRTGRAILSDSFEDLLLGADSGKIIQLAC